MSKRIIEKDKMEKLIKFVDEIITSLTHLLLFQLIETTDILVRRWLRLRFVTLSERSAVEDARIKDEAIFPGRVSLKSMQ